jgi:hypothetical protein
MKKYKLNTDKQSIIPSNESIKDKKDFGKLLHNYESFTKRPKKPIYKDPKLFLFFIIIGLLAYIIFNEVNENEKAEINTEQLDK